MKSNQISINYPLDQYKYLEKCCKQLQISLEDFIVSVTTEKIDEWEKDGMPLALQYINPDKIKIFLIPVIELLADETLQENAWVKKTIQTVNCYSEVSEMFSEACEAFLENNSQLTELQKKMLSELKELMNSFNRTVGDAEYKDMSLILNNPEWKKIQHKAQDFLKDLLKGYIESREISINYPPDQYKRLIYFCEENEISLEDFLVFAPLEKVDEWEDQEMLERWEKDGTRANIDADRADPNRVVYIKEGDTWKEMLYSDVVRLRKEELKKKRGSGDA